MEEKQNNLDPESVKKMKVEILMCTCNRCKRSWPVYTGRVPHSCAFDDCRSPYWNKIRVKDLKEDRKMKPKEKA